MNIGNTSSLNIITGGTSFMNDISVVGTLNAQQTVYTQSIDTVASSQSISIETTTCSALSVGHGSMITTFKSPVVFNSTTTLSSISTTGNISVSYTHLTLPTIYSV